MGATAGGGAAGNVRGIRLLNPPPTPVEHGSGWVHPTGQLERMLRANQAHLASLRFEVGDRPATEVARDARAHLLTTSRRYVAEYQDGLEDFPLRDDTPIVMAGHQPELFHPGVWFKNFVISEVARRQSALAIHLITDPDLSRSSSIRVPTGSIECPEVATLAFDDSLPAMPFEAREIQDITTFRTFGLRTADAIRPLVPRPLVEILWPMAVTAARHRRNLGQVVSQARHRLEHAWGLRTLEVPLSRICSGTAFHRFLLHVLMEISRFQEVFHAELSAYRQVFRVRSHTHPAPSLRRQGTAYETPFWIWSRDEPVRRPLWVDWSKDSLRLRGENPRGGLQDLTLSLDNGSGQVADCLRQLEQQTQDDIQIRPRALMTTMFARLFLCDLFIHGVGGGKYDRLTDRLIEQFFGVRPPEFAWATATFRLPTAEVAGARLPARLPWRERWYHPERHLASPPGAVETEPAILISLKRSLIASRPTEGPKKDWHDRLERVNLQLRQFVPGLRDGVHCEADDLPGTDRHETFLRSREHPYCLFSEDILRPKLLDLAANSA